MASAIGVILLALTFGVAEPASAAGANRWVSKSPTVAGNGTSCTKPGFNTIQGAVNASAGGDKVTVCSGTYEEQVTIDKNLTLAGKTGATVVPPASPPTFQGALVFAGTTDGSQGPTKVNVMGLTVDGQSRAQGGGTRTLTSPTGIRYENASGTISNNHVTGIRLGPDNGVQSGIGILAHTNNAHPDKVTINGNTVDDIQKGHIVADSGDVNSLGAGGSLSGTVSNNIITGDDLADYIAQNGVQVSRGAVSSVVNNQINGFMYTGTGDPGATASPVLVFDAGTGVKVMGNDMSRFDIGVAVDNSPGVVVDDNTITGGRSGTDADFPRACDHNLRGIDVLNSSSTVSDNTVTDIQADPSGGLTGCQFGRAIYATKDSGPAVTSKILRNTVSDFQKSGIYVAGDGNTGTIQSNVLDGGGNDDIIARNMIGVLFGAKGTVGAASAGGAAGLGNQLNNIGAYSPSTPNDTANGALLTIDAASGTSFHRNVFRHNAAFFTDPEAQGYTVLHSSTPDISGTQNDWERDTATEISQQIFDGNDDPSLGIVDFQPFIIT